MLEQYSEQSKEQKLQKLSEFLDHLGEHLKSAEEFKGANPDREDLNALIELNLAIQEEARAVSDLVEIEDDCAEDWEDLEQARGSLSRTLARIGHSNWIALGPSNSRRFNQLFFHLRNDAESDEGAVIVSELIEVSKRLSAEELTPALRNLLERLVKHLEGDTGGSFLELLSDQLDQLEGFLDLSLFDQSLDKGENWLSLFHHLAEAVALGDVEERYLFDERDFALRRLEKLEGMAEGQESEVLVVLQEIAGHLSGLEQSFADDTKFEEWLETLSTLWSKLEVTHQSELSSDTLSCAVCSAELAGSLNRCTSCGAPVLRLEKARVVLSPPERGKSRLLDSLWDTWAQFQDNEIDQDQLLETFETLSAPILQAVQNIASPSPILVDFSINLKSFQQLSNRNALERNWPTLFASGQAVIEERVKALKRD